MDKSLSIFVMAMGGLPILLSISFVAIEVTKTIITYSLIGYVLLIGGVIVITIDV
jgi:hypothetical protein